MRSSTSGWMSPTSLPVPSVVLRVVGPDAPAPDPTWRRSMLCVSRDRTSLSGLLGLPEDFRNLVDLRQQVVGDLGVEGALGAGRTGQLGGLVDELMQLRVLLEVRRLEVVGPEHPEVVLDEL